MLTSNNSNNRKVEAWKSGLKWYRVTNQNLTSSGLMGKGILEKKRRGISKVKFSTELVKHREGSVTEIGPVNYIEWREPRKVKLF